MKEKWTLNKIPPKNHPDVASFANDLFDISKTEKDRLEKPDQFLANYNLYRGKQLRKGSGVLERLSVNLYFANIERTVANITSRRPQGEVVDLDGFEDDAEKLLSKVLVKWWKEANQQAAIKEFARVMEIYGIGIEKPFWNKTKQMPGTLLTDPFAFFPAPGNWHNISEDAPYICYAYQDFIYKVEQDYDVTGIRSEDAYTLLGAEREESHNYFRSSIHGIRGGTVHSVTTAYDSKTELCLIKEIWLRDTSTRVVKEEQQVVDEFGEVSVQEVSRTEQIYPDGIRCILIALSENGHVVLSDTANPNINPKIPVEIAATTYPFGRLPVYTQNSYKDLISIWGFAANEQVGDLLVDINKIINRLKAYVLNVMAPPLIVQKNCGITRAMITAELESTGRLILIPEIPNARIEFMQVPNLPSNFFDVLDLLVKFFDRIYAVQEVDRGQTPTGVIAGVAIQALQERNQIVMQAKTSAIEDLAVEKSRWAIGLWQNHGTQIDSISVDGEPTEFIGTNYAGRNFSYTVESGSTTPRTNVQKIEAAKWLWETKAIDQRALLEILGVEDLEDIIERTAESQLGAALQVLISAGLDESEAMKLQEFLLQPEQNSEKVRAGKEKAK